MNEFETAQNNAFKLLGLDPEKGILQWIGAKILFEHIEDDRVGEKVAAQISSCRDFHGGFSLNFTNPEHILYGDQRDRSNMSIHTHIDGKISAMLSCMEPPSLLLEEKQWKFYHLKIKILKIIPGF